MYSRYLRCVFLVVVLSAFLSSIARARETAPEWLTALAAEKTFDPSPEHPAVVLLDESRLEVSPEGVFTTRTRWAVRLFAPEGRKHAIAQVSYDQSSEKVKVFKAWTLRPDGRLIAYRRDKLIDRAVYDHALELYADAHQQIISGFDDAVPGAVFGFESIVEERTIFGQRTWSFQSTLPTTRSSLTVTLPPGWEAKTWLYNLDALVPQISGNSTTWSMTQLPASKAEPLSPHATTYLPWLALDLRPPNGIQLKQTPAVFETWRDLSAYFIGRYETAAAIDPAIKAKADFITANASTLMGRIQALCRHAQSVNYISINLDGGNGGGWIPRAATQVLRCNYGDCKDKSTLLRALLNSSGIRSYPVILYSGDRGRTRENWPSPLQFNHCIVAIAVDDTVIGPAVASHPTLGRLLFFDPTDEFTSLGHLPASATGALSLILASETDGLFPLPEMQAAQNRWERTITAKLSPNGDVTGCIQEVFTDQAAARARASHRGQSPSEFQKQFEGWLASTLPIPRVRDLKANDAFDEARFTLNANFDSLGYGKSMRDRLLVFKPVMVARRENMELRKLKRTQPVVLSAKSFSEHSEIELPAGFRIDEQIAPVDLTTPFGRYRAQATEAQGKLIVERSLELSSAQISPADYESVRTFFEKILQSEQTPVVLEKL